MNSCTNATLLRCPTQSVGAANDLFALLIQTVLVAQCAISPPEMWPRDYGPEAIKSGLSEYDFIVIGAGSAGAIVAARLSEIESFKILLIEAGGDPTIESELPNLELHLQKTPVDWNFYAKSKFACKLGGPRGCYWPRGKMLGGSSGSNKMVYSRGKPIDFNSWGLQHFGWGWNDLFPYFKKSEGNQNPNFVAERDGYYHNSTGPLKVDSFGNLTPYHAMIIEAEKERGIPLIADINADVSNGFVNFQGTVFQGRRQSTAKAFLIPAKERDNLHVIKNAMVEKIVIENKRAVGVQFRINRQEHSMVARARKEVILSAGAIMSPILLMLSGIGPKNQLKKFKIPLEVDLPVGKNLHDHVNVLMFFKMNTTEAKTAATALDGVYNLVAHNTGSLVSGAKVASFISTANRTDYADIENIYVLYPRNSSGLNLSLKLFIDDEKVRSQILNENKNAFIVGSYVVLLHPQSRGTVKLGGKSIYDPPAIDPKYFAESDDMKTLLNGLRQHIELTKTKSFKKNGAAFLRVSLPECDHVPDSDSILSDKYLKCYIQHFSTTTFHPGGTSKMGPKADRKAVVGVDLKVFGIQRLRQIDAGIFPDTVSGHLNAAVIAVAEKGADLIKSQWRH